MVEGPEGGGEDIAQDCEAPYRLEACDIFRADSVTLENLDLLLISGLSEHLPSNPEQDVYSLKSAQEKLSIHQCDVYENNPHACFRGRHDFDAPSKDIGRNGR